MRDTGHGKCKAGDIFVAQRDGLKQVVNLEVARFLKVKSVNYETVAKTLFLLIACSCVG